MTISLRLGSNDHKDAAYIRELIKAIKASDGCFDEVWLATSYGLPSLSQAKEDARQMAAAAQAFRDAGITASMQISRTVGHHASSLYNYPSGFSPDAFDCIADIDGESDAGVFCWNNAAFRQYWCEILPIYAGFQPTRIWIDDDIRLRLMGRSRALCFCDHCIALFGRQTGKAYDRASFKKAFIGDIAVRRAYIDFQVKTIGAFAHELFSALKKAAPQAIPCLQNGGATPLPIMAQKEILAAMKAASGFVPSFRAGAGFYNDHNPQEVLTKALTINYMNARIAPFAENLSCEIENLPHTAYGKSAEFTCIEGALYIAMGSNELSVTLMTNLETLDFRALEFGQLSRYRDFFEAYTKANVGTENAGIAVYQPDDSLFAEMDAHMQPYFNDSCVWEGAALMRLGLPFHAAPKGESYLLTEKAVPYLSAKDMDFLLHQTVITDMNTVKRLFDRKLADGLCCTCAAVAKEHRSSVGEVTVFEKNVNFKRRYLNFDVNFVPAGDTVKAFSTLFCRSDSTVVGNGISVVETTCGARWVVSSPTIQDDEIAFARREGLRLALAYANGGVSAYVASPQQIAVVPRMDAEGAVRSVLLLNVSAMRSEAFDVCVKGNAETVTLLRPGEEPTAVPFVKNGDCLTVSLPTLHGWQCCALMLA